MPGFFLPPALIPPTAYSFSLALKLTLRLSPLSLAYSASISGVILAIFQPDVCLLGLPLERYCNYSSKICSDFVQMGLGSMSPDPPDESTRNLVVSNSDAAEESQESTTLRNPVQPLPGTQTDTQPGSLHCEHHSPDHHEIPPIQHFVRPGEHAVPDLEVGFTWGPRIKINPGQFSKRPKPSSTLVTDLNSDSNEVPSIVRTGTVGSLDEPAVVADGGGIQTSGPDMHMAIPVSQTPLLSSVQPPYPVNSPDYPLAQGQGSVVRDHRYQATCKTQVLSDDSMAKFAQKKPPFKEHQPLRQVIEDIDHLPSPATITKMHTQGQFGESLHENLHTKPIYSHPKQNKLQKPLHHGHVQTQPQKPRTSLRNDVSVSSNHPPSQLPHHIPPRVGTVKRNARQGQGRSSGFNTPSTKLRATSSNRSNTKRKRKAQNQLETSSSRLSHRFSQEHEETPSLRSCQLSPQDQLKKVFIDKLAMHKGEVAGYLNGKWNDIEQQMDQQFHGIIANLKCKLKRQETDAARYKERTRDKDGVIRKLEKDHDQLVATLQATEKNLQERSAKFSKLDEKCRTYKEHLNSAIAEQQELYRATKAKCDGAITQMRDEESKRKHLQERERKQAEAARERLNQLIKNTIAEHAHKERQLNDKIEFLSQKVEGRDADLELERERTQALLQQHANITSVQDTLKEFQAKMDQVVFKVSETALFRDKQDDPRVGEMHVKIDRIMENLHSLDERACSRDEISRELQELNEKAVVSILGKLEPLLESQLDTRSGLDSLSEGLEEYVDEVWAALEDRQAVLEERVEQRQAENEQRTDFLRRELETSEQDRVQQDQFIHGLEQTIEDRQSEIEVLCREVAELEQGQADSLVQSEYLEQIQEEHAKLKEEVTVKTAHVSDLQASLEKSKSALEMKEKDHRETTEELRRVLEKRLAEAQSSQVQAVEAAQQNAMVRMNEIKIDLERRFSQVLEERAVLQRELEAAKQQLMATKDDGSKTSEKIHNLEQELKVSKTETIRISENVNQRDAEQQITTEQQAKLIEDLQSQIESTGKKYNNLVENAKSYDVAACKVLQSLKQWTSDYSAIQELGTELSKAEDREVNQIDPRFQPLVQIQLLQKAVAQYCRTQTEAVEMLSGGMSNSDAFKTAAQATTRRRPATSGFQETMSQSSLGGLLNHLRRVVVRSPADCAPSPTPPSVQNEKERRRAADPPRSIMKPVSCSQSQESVDGAPSQGQLTRMAPIRNKSRDRYHRGRRLESASVNLNRGPYNRLVAGSQALFNLPVAEKELDRAPSDGVRAQEATTEEVKNCKRRLEEPEDSRKKAKLTFKRREAPLTTPHSSPPEPVANSGSSVEHAPPAPRKTGYRLNVDEQPSSPVLYLQISRDNQHRTAI